MQSINEERCIYFAIFEKHIYTRVAEFHTQTTCNVCNADIQTFHSGLQIGAWEYANEGKFRFGATYTNGIYQMFDASDYLFVTSEALDLIAKKAIKTGESVRDLLKESGLYTEEQIDAILDPFTMV